MKKILMIGPFSKLITGMSVANNMLYKSLKSKYKVDIIDTLRNEDFENKENQGKFIVSKFLYICKDMFAELSSILLKAYDIVYITPGQSFLGFARFFLYILVSSIRKIDIYLHIHGSKFREMYDGQSKIKKQMIKYFLNKVKGVVVLGDSLRYMLKDILPEEKILVCENGVEDRFAASNDEIVKKINSHKFHSKKGILFLSNLMEDKGIIQLLKASEYFSDKDISINLAGQIEPQIKDYIYQYLNKYPSKIKYYGIVDGSLKRELLLKNHILILPSKDEGQPISILEAYANGCMVITDETVGGIKDIFSDNKNGYCCDYDKCMTIVEGIRKSWEYKDSMAVNYSLYREKYTESKFVERIVDIFEDK